MENFGQTGVMFNENVESEVGKRTVWFTQLSVDNCAHMCDRAMVSASSFPCPLVNGQ